MIESLCVVIPVFNAAGSLRKLYARLSAVLTSLKHPYEIIMVEDCGGDSSWDEIRKLTRADERVRGIKLSRNFGQHNALLCGIRAARYSTIVTIDDDLQHPPEEIPALLSLLESGSDVVYGIPKKKQHGFIRNLVTGSTKFVMRSIIGVSSAQDVSAFRAFHTSLRNAFEDYHGVFVSIDVLLSWGTTRFTTVAVEHAQREYGRSHYTIIKLIRHTFNMITGYSTFLLRIAIFTGFAFILFGAGIFFFVLIRYFILGGKVIPGFSFLASIITIFAGVQLFLMGIIGEYLARMYFRVIEKPSYVIAAVEGFDEQRTEEVRHARKI